MNPVCEQNKKDCFAYKRGKCHILDNTHFETKDGVKDCPFYKKKRGDKRWR